MAKLLSRHVLPFTRIHLEGAPATRSALPPQPRAAAAADDRRAQPRHCAMKPATRAAPLAADAAAHAQLRAHPLLYACVGVLHTLLTAGVVFGWASLLPVLRREGVALSAPAFAAVFAHGAIGNYLSSLPFGLLLDRAGPRACGAAASVLFGAGCFLCSFAGESSVALDVGFTLLGFAGPAVQLPTLHLARLFPGEAREGGGGGAALMMSAQAGAFDGGTVVFCVFAALADGIGLTSRAFFRLYMLVPAFTLLTALLVWPNSILPDACEVINTTTSLRRTDSYLGRMAYLNTAAVDSSDDDDLPLTSAPSTVPSEASERTLRSSLKDAPLSVILTRPPFYCLALWVSVHILKLNFVVATINDQLRYSLPDDPEISSRLVDIFGVMLPFGFLILPLVAFLLTRPMVCFQLANAVGLLYGAVLTFLPSSYFALVSAVFAPVATSRQLVYSTVFHQTGELFGFSNYGVMLGLVNVIVSAVSLLQGPLVEWAEASRTYYGPNAVLLACTFPLILLALFTRTELNHRDSVPSPVVTAPVTESTRLIPRNSTVRRRIGRSIYADIIFIS